MKIKYTDATIGQLTKAKLKSGFPSLCPTKPLDELVLSIKREDQLEKYRSYDRYGRLTIVGKAKRQQDLASLNLPETTTVQEYLAKWQEDFNHSIAKMCRKITKTNKTLIKNANV